MAKTACLNSLQHEPRLFIGRESRIAVEPTRQVLCCVKTAIKCLQAGARKQESIKCCTGSWRKLGGQYTCSDRRHNRLQCPDCRGLLRRFQTPKRKSNGANPKELQSGQRSFIHWRFAMAPARGHAGRSRMSGSRTAAKADKLDTALAAFYRSRWTQLRQSLAQPTEHVALQNAFASHAHQQHRQWRPASCIGGIEVQSAL